MRTDGFFLANYAKQQPDGLTLVGAGWTTWTVNGQPTPEKPITVSGALVARMMLEPHEADGQHVFRVRLVDADDQEMLVAKLSLNAQRDTGVPLSWETSAAIILNLNDVKLPALGTYRFLLEDDQGQRMALVRFQVIAG